MESQNFNTGMYIIDKEYRILNINRALHEIYPDVKIGELCYKSLALQDAPCTTCPLITNDVLFFNPIRKEWISANAAEMDYPGHGSCYNVQFKTRKSIGGTKREIVCLEKIDEYVSEIQSADGNECVIAAYYEPGSPVFYANEAMIELMGYDSFSELMEAVDGLIVNMIHPEDRKKAGKEMKGLEVPGTTFETAFRARKKDGAWFWVIAHGKSILTTSNKIAVLCVCTGMTTFLNEHVALQREKEKLEQKEEMNESLLNKIPGAYHRCSTADGFPFLYISESFEKTVGWTKEEIAELFENKFINLVYPEDLHLFDGLLEQIAEKGQGSTIYRLKKKDVGYCWVQDSTMYIDAGKESFYQCTLSDITSFVEQQEKMTIRNMELLQKTNLFETITENIPSGFHRCAAEEGCPLLYIGEHFTEIVGWTKEEIATEFNNLYSNMIWQEDNYAVDTYEKMRQMRGKGNSYDTSIYRIKHKDGGYRWVADSTMFVDCGEDSFYQGIITDITPYIEEMEKAKAIAEDSNRAKSTFLFNLSHDIRTPMNAILGFSNIIDENASDTALVREAIGKIKQSGGTLLTLLNDVLELSRIERGKEEINAQPVHMYEHRDSLVEMFSKEMKDAGIEFLVETDIEHEYVMMDPLKVSRIVMNMLSNAKKFTPAGGTVTLGIKEKACKNGLVTYCLYTRDTGIGMSEEFQKRAFEQFERERSTTESGINGSGLGMAIISRLTTLMGGTVSLKSELGKGTEISAILSVPLIKAVDIPEKKYMEKVLDLSGKKVLLVEDNEFNREIAHYILESTGFVVDEAENGAIALDKIIHNQPGTYELILMDIQMPVMDGYMATQEIRRIPDKEKAQIPIIAMTANAFEEDRKRCLDIGMNGHIGKPFESEKLLQELSNVL